MRAPACRRRWLRVPTRRSQSRCPAAWNRSMRLPPPRSCCSSSYGGGERLSARDVQEREVTLLEAAGIRRTNGCAPSPFDALRRRFYFKDLRGKREVTERVSSVRHSIQQTFLDVVA